MVRCWGNIGVESRLARHPMAITLFRRMSEPLAINAKIFTEFQFKPLRDLLPVTQVVDVPGCLVVDI